MSEDGMKPTPEQLEKVVEILDQGSVYEMAQEAWDVIAPIVLEEAAKICDGERVKASAADAWKMAGAAEHCGNLIRVLAAKKS